MSERLRKQIAEKCIHFNGVQNKTCRLGIPYDGHPDNFALPCLPCLPGNKWACSKFQQPTEEQIKAREDEIAKSMARFAKVMPLVRQVKAEHRGQNWAGSFPCPACGTGTLRMSHAAYNGHVHGRCSTDGCVAWME